MIKVETKTPEEVRRAGLEALEKALGPAGMLRFIQLFEKGKGNYTKDREKWLNGVTMDDVIKDVKKFRKKK